MTDIIIVSYKDEVELRRCIDSIEKYCNNYMMYIEDNNIGQNNGYTKSVNTAIKKGSGEYIWLLNSDAVIKNETTQQALIDRLGMPNVGIVGSMQLDYLDHDLIAHGGTLNVLPGRHKGGRVSMGHCQVPERQTWINFASVMLSREMIAEVGLLDESFFLICSDSDYCFTCRQAGWSVYYEPRSQVFHRLKASKSITEWHKKDMETFMKKWEIVPDPTQPNGFRYGRTFAKLDMFP
jgi:GT2 family glycosyltransferase